jgi:hypothetical protein
MRVTIFIIVVAIHLVLLLMFLASRRTPGETIESPPITVFIVYQPQGPTEQSPPPPNPNSRQSRAAPVRHVAPRGAQSAAPKPLPSTPEGSPSPEDISPPTTIDWNQEADVVAKHVIEAEIDAERKASALTRCHKPLPGRWVRGPEFGWSHAQTHRVEQLPEGKGVLVNLNDRCSILLTGIFALPLCSLAKPAPRGDLFKNMHGPIEFGDWMDTAPASETVDPSCDRH